MKNRIIILSIAIVAFLSACKKDDNNVYNPNPINEEELITTVSLSFQSNTFPTLPIVYNYRDLDSIGGNAPTVDTIILSRDVIYMLKLYFLDESKNPVVDISEEVAEEANDHLVVFSTDTNYLKVEISDFDSNTPALPLGLNSLVTVKGPIVTSMRVTLKHQPGIKNGDPNLGETDVEVVYPVIIY
jgi:hypothetical protein